MTALALLEQNFTQHAALLPSLTSGMHVSRGESLTYADCGLSCDTFNIIHVTNGRTLRLRDLRDAVAHYRKKDFAFCLWIAREQLTEGAKEILQTLGLTQAGEDAGMVLDLDRYAIGEVAGAAHMKRVATVEEIAHFSSVEAHNWTPPDEKLMEYFGRVSPVLLSPESKVIWLNYYLDGKAVGAIELFPSGEEVIGIYNVSTLAEYRGRGIGTALMKQGLNLAKELGYRTAVLQASPDGFGIYQRLGFQEITRYYEFR